MRMTPRRLALGVIITFLISILLLALVPKNRPRKVTFPLKWTPRQVTYTSNSSLHKGQNDIVIQVPKPKVDRRISQYAEADIMQIYNTLKFLSRGLEKRWQYLRLFPKIERDPELNKAWSEKTMELIRYMIDVRNGSETTLPGIETIEDLLQEMTILKKKVFPLQPRKLHCKGCFTRRFTPLIHAWTACESPGSIQLVILVKSTVREFAARMAIRDTWGSITDNNSANVRLVFIVGDSGTKETALLKVESNNYRDIVQGNFKESYYNTTYNIIGGFKWLHHSCPGAKFVMVTSTDVFVNVHGIQQLLSKYGDRETFQNYQVGKCHKSVAPHRIPDFRDYVTTFEYDLDVFPPFADGSLAIYSVNLVREIIKLSPNIPYIGRADVYLGLVLEALGRGCHDVQGLLIENENKIPAVPYFAAHPVTSEKLRTDYRNFLHTSSQALSGASYSDEMLA